MIEQLRGSERKVKAHKWLAERVVDQQFEEAARLRNQARDNGKTRAETNPIDAPAAPISQVSTTPTWVAAIDWLIRVKQLKAPEHGGLETPDGQDAQSLIEESVALVEPVIDPKDMDRCQHVKSYREAKDENAVSAVMVAQLCLVLQTNLS